MMRSNKKIDWLAAANDGVLVGAAIISIMVTLLDFLGILDQVKWLSDRIAILTLLSLSLLLLSVVVDRKSRLETIQATLDNIVATYSLGVQYLDNAEAVITELERTVRQAGESIMALGAKSTATGYLEAIEMAVSQRSIIYYRLLDRLDTTHELHEHLKKLIHTPNVQIGWTPREKYGNLTVTEHECVIVFPAPYKNKFSGLRLPGQANSRRYIQHFLEAFSKGIPLRTERSIELLCEKCSCDITRKPDEMKRLLSEEFQAFLERQDGAKPA
jgi:hypothetical protein